MHTTHFSEEEMKATHALILVLKAERLGKRASQWRAQRLFDVWHMRYSQVRRNATSLLNQQRVAAGAPITPHEAWHGPDVAPMTDADIPF